MKFAHFELPRYAAVLIVVALISVPAQAQVSSAIISGTVTSQAGAGIANANVTVKDTATGHSISVTTNSTGFFSATNLPAGAYEVSVSAGGFAPSSVKVSVAAGAAQKLNIPMAPAQGLSLQSLGFSTSQTQGNAKEQARLNKRSHMLQMHQRLGLITLIPMVATLVSGGLAGGRSTSSTDRDLHVALGSTTAGLYFATAYYAIFAPKIPGTKTEGPIRWHKALAWVHGPGMILTPILGAMAFDQKSKGQRVHGIARAHGVVAVVTAAAYGAAILSVSINPKTKQHIAAIFGFHPHQSRAPLGDEAYLGE